MEEDYYEGYIDPLDGSDWNQSTPIDPKPTLADFKKTVTDYLTWEVGTILNSEQTKDNPNTL